MSKKYKLFLKIHVLRYLFQARWNKHIHPVSPIEGNLDGMQTAIIWGLWKVAGGWGRLEFQVPPKRLSVHHYFFFSTSPGLSTLQHPKGNIGLQTGLHKSPSSGFTRRRREFPNAWRQCGKPLVCLLSLFFVLSLPQATPWWQELKLHLDLSETRVRGGHLPLWPVKMRSRKSGAALYCISFFLHPLTARPRCGCSCRDAWQKG